MAVAPTRGSLMARPGFSSHPKFRRLVHLLRCPVPHARGYLECLWEVAYEDGNPIIGDSTDVELAAQWPGEPGQLTQTLLDCRLIDSQSGGKYAIHDLLEHAPDYVRKRAARAQERAQRKAAADSDRQTADSGGQRPPNGSTPSPAQPSPNKNPPTPQGGNRVVKTQPPDKAPETPALSSADFLTAWNAVVGFTPARKLTGARLKAFQARTKDADWLAGWREALAKASRKPFCRGANDQSWRATADWFLRPDTVTRLLEGQYGPEDSGPAPDPTADRRARDAKILADREADASARAKAARLPAPPTTPPADGPAEQPEPEGGDW